MWWGGHNTIELEFREIRDKDHAELAEIVGCSQAFFTKMIQKLESTIVATNLGIPAGFAYIVSQGDEPVVYVKDHMRGKGIEDRLIRVFRPAGVKSAAGRRSTGQ